MTNFQKIQLAGYDLADLDSACHFLFGKSYTIMQESNINQLEAGQILNYLAS